jgi:hypothetical protein
MMFPYASATDSRLSIAARTKLNYKQQCESILWYAEASHGIVACLQICCATDKKVTKLSVKGQKELRELATAISHQGTETFEATVKGVRESKKCVMDPVASEIMEWICLRGE